RHARRAGLGLPPCWPPARGRRPPAHGTCYPAPRTGRVRRRATSPHANSAAPAPAAAHGRTGVPDPPAVPPAPVPAPPFGVPVVVPGAATARVTEPEWGRATYGKDVPKATSLASTPSPSSA